MDVQMDGRTDTWMDRMDRWVDGWVELSLLSETSKVNTMQRDNCFNSGRES